MTNAQTVVSRAVRSGAVAPWEAITAVITGRELPVHTRKGWKERGYSVKEGSPPLFTAGLWVKGKKGFYRKKCAFYSLSQTEPEN